MDANTNNIKQTVRGAQHVFDHQAAPQCQSINLSIARSGLELLGLPASVLLVYFSLIFNYHNTQVGI